MSGPLCDYVALHRHAAIRACLLDHPSVALRLTVAHMLVGSDLWQVAPQKTTSRKESTSESVAASQGAKRFEIERDDVFALLGLTPFDSPYSQSKKLADGSVTLIFAQLLDMEDAQVMRVMTLAMAASLAAGTDLIEAVTYAMPVDMDKLWEPDDAFFDILRDKRVINAMVKDIAGKSCADGALTDTGKVQKDIIRNRMAGHGVSADKARADWRPRWMQVPASHYLDRATCPPSAAVERAAKVMDTTPSQKAA